MFVTITAGSRNTPVTVLKPKMLQMRPKMAMTRAKMVKMRRKRAKIRPKKAKKITKRRSRGKKEAKIEFYKRPRRATRRPVRRVSARLGLVRPELFSTPSPS